MTLYGRPARSVAVLIFTVVFLAACGSGTNDTAETGDLSGRYVGYSWGGEASGVSFDDADKYIQTILELDEDGTILDATMWFWVQKDGYWTTRQSGNAFVEVDFSVDPEPAVPGADYEAGSSMFTVYTADMMSFYATAVDEDGTVAVAMVDPITRYQLEMKLPAGFDFSRRVGEFAIGPEGMVPTIRTSGSGFVKPDDWSEVAGRTIFSVHDEYSHVVNDLGELAGVDEESSVRELVEALGVSFEEDQPVSAGPTYGYFGLGGWKGNYEAIADYLTGRDATDLTSLVNWSVDKFAAGVNESNEFGVDVGSGATKTAQWSTDGIAGATVRMSRESTSYQRALADAGIIDEDEVIIGRF